MTSWCQCELGTLYPDGVVRCDLNFKFARKECDKKEHGSIKLYKPPRVPKPKITKEVSDV